MSDPKRHEVWEIGEFSDKGSRPRMEDVSLVLDLYENQTFGTHSILLGIFDGHSGVQCAKYISTQIPEEFFNQYVKSDNIPQALHESFVFVDDQWLNHAKNEKLEDGSTALCCLIVNDMLYVANTGDCRSILVYENSYEQISTDHNLKDPRESERVLSRGGHIVGGRLEGKIAVSRAFGDLSLKTGSSHNIQNSKKQPLTCEPEVKMLEISNDAEFLLIGCDGLFEEFSNDDIVTFLRQQFSTKCSAKTAVEALVNEAISRGTNDNVSAILLKFGKKYKKFLVAEKANKLGNNKKNKIGNPLKLFTRQNSRENKSTKKQTTTTTTTTTPTHRPATVVNDAFDANPKHNLLRKSKSWDNLKVSLIE
eukprot:TRINITY_DN190_c0_g1_i2.p1 TRINITY_DN190_c0_g1~~TRINITY_DN190_c0_g1_i2.p1  ORF type:complete len:365 (-),score=76.89 TRINITY_DN190_c0_g1_i2:738-1832(-)